MHNNYYFLRVLASSLRQKLMYARLKQCFSQEKDELVLGFERQNGEEFWMKCCLGPQFSCLQFPDNFHRAGRNSVDLFSDVLLAEVQEVEMYENERAFSLHFLGDFVLLFKMYGNRANIILFRDGEFQSLFQSRLKKDAEISLANLHRPIDQSWEAFQASDGNYSVLFPTFGKEIKSHLLSLRYENALLNPRWDILQTLKADLENPTLYVYHREDGVYLSLLKSEAEALYVGHDPLEALNALYKYHYSIGEFLKEKTQLLAFFQRAQDKTRLYLQDLLNQGSKRGASVPYEEIANIIMAHLHLIPANVNAVELPDFYRDSIIKVKLNASLSASQNAENYYRKSKNYAKELAHWQEQVDRKRDELKLWEERWEQVNQATHRKQLKAFIPLLTKDTSQKAIEEIPFKVFDVQGWTVWVGRNAKNNDLLTMKYAKRHDVWLHARDVAGSHVVIRNPQQKVVPKQVIEEAAGLAAHFSKRQHESLCPVIISSKKYIRKTKDLLAGQVIVDREEVILVPPARID